MTYWLLHGLSGRADDTVTNYTNLAEKHVIPALGARKLRDLSVEDVDKWLAKKAKTLADRTLPLIHSILNRSVKNAQKRDKVKRNVVDLCDVPSGQDGRPSKSFTLDEAEAGLVAAETSRLYAYIVLSMLMGARTEELRALRWDHVVAYDESREKWLPVTDVGWDHKRFGIHVWRSARVTNDTKTKKSRRTLACPARCAAALVLHRDLQLTERQKAGKRWQENGLVFASMVRTEMNARKCRGELPTSGRQSWTERRGVDAARTTSQLRLSAVRRRRTVGTDLPVGRPRQPGRDGDGHRHQIRPVMQEGVTVMDYSVPRRPLRTRLETVVPQFVPQHRTEALCLNRHKASDLSQPDARPAGFEPATS